MSGTIATPTLGSSPIETSPVTGISLLPEYSKCLHVSPSVGHATSHLHLRATYYGSDVRLQSPPFTLPPNFVFPPRY
ncbi:hypothetical protein A2U01_0027696, partial [Trifolium medium]|nr:hypothetical protein [Trifolium medium]